MSRVSTRTLVVSGMLVALVLAGIVSFYASSDPDGLNKVAADKGFSSAETEHVSTDSPLAGYQTKGVENGRLSGGLAGIAGSVAVLLLAGGAAVALRRRSPTDPGQGQGDEHTQDLRRDGVREQAAQEPH